MSDVCFRCGADLGSDHMPSCPLHQPPVPPTVWVYNGLVEPFDFIVEQYGDNIRVVILQPGTPGPNGVEVMTAEPDSEGQAQPPVPAPRREQAEAAEDGSDPLDQTATAWLADWNETHGIERTDQDDINDLADTFRRHMRPDAALAAESIQLAGELASAHRLILQLTDRSTARDAELDALKEQRGDDYTCGYFDGKAADPDGVVRAESGYRKLAAENERLRAERDDGRAHCSRLAESEAQLRGLCAAAWRALEQAVRVCDRLPNQYRETRSQLKAAFTNTETP